jgi:hypothetical protein
VVVHAVSSAGYAALILGSLLTAKAAASRLNMAHPVLSKAIGVALLSVVILTALHFEYRNGFQDLVSGS